MSGARRVRLHEWREVRELRLRALSDPQASIAFLDTVEAAEARDDGFWQERTAGAAMGQDAAQFVVEDDQRWLGSATVIVQHEGSLDEGGNERPYARALVVGVFVDPSGRGRGWIDTLLQECADFASSIGFENLYLDVHADNDRAIAAYTRCGFTPTGVEFTSVIGSEVEMVRTL